MFNELDYEEDDVLASIENEQRRKKVREDSKLFKSSINKKKLSKEEMDELFLY